MNIQPTNSVNFNAKMIKNSAFEDLRKYAIEHNKFPIFDRTLKNIDKIRKDTLIQMDICYTGDYPTVVFSRYEHNWDKNLQMPSFDYFLKRQVDYISEKKENPLKFALKRFIKLGNNAPENKMFQEVVIIRDESKKPYCLF